MANGCKWQSIVVNIPEHPEMLMILLSYHTVDVYHIVFSKLFDEQILKMCQMFYHIYGFVSYFSYFSCCWLFEGEVAKN